MKKIRKYDLSQKETKWEYINSQITLTSEEFNKLSQADIIDRLNKNAIMRFQIAYPGADAFMVVNWDYGYNKSIFKYTKSPNLVRVNAQMKVEGVYTLDKYLLMERRRFRHRMWRKRQDMEVLEYFKDLNWYRYRGYQPYLEKI